MTPEDDALAIEDPLEISIIDANGGTARIVTMRTPGDDADLLFGYLFNEGVIDAASDVTDMTYSTPTPPAAASRAVVRLAAGRTAEVAHRSGAVQASCGACGADSLGDLTLEPALYLTDDSRIDATWIHTLPDQMRGQQPTFNQTGGLHAAALFELGGQMIVSREDIGRHNALDKAIGYALQFGLLGEDLAVCVSGRMSYEILQKALRAGIAVIAGVGAPSSLAVAIANDFNATLLGFVRNGAYNIYSAPQRIVT